MPVAAHRTPDPRFGFSAILGHDGRRPVLVDVDVGGVGGFAG